MVFDEERLIKHASWALFPGYDSDCYEVSESTYNEARDKSRSPSRAMDYNYDSDKCESNRNISKGNTNNEGQKQTPIKSEPHLSNAPKSLKPTEGRTCGACRETGHDRRVCPRLITESDDQRQRAMAAALQAFIENITAAATPSKRSVNKSPASTGGAKKDAEPNDEDKAKSGASPAKGKNAKARTTRHSLKSNHTPPAAQTPQKSIGVKKNRTSSRARVVSKSVRFAINAN
ncbi:hypothetical protein TWF481_010033 [Arthrobotrys musiformis]|uniref:CCHC-type domain-containing protein n=1 Tax=Arthrobotrys musiformis TaxID=47236 RepID=A0AAV9W0Y0_9PEZI